MITYDEIEQLKAKVAALEGALLARQSNDYEVIVIRKPEPEPPKKWRGYWNIWATKGRCHAHVHTTKEAAANASYPRKPLDCICVEWEEGKTEGRWYSVMETA